MITITLSDDNASHLGGQMRTIPIEGSGGVDPTKIGIRLWKPPPFSFGAFFFLGKSC